MTTPFQLINANTTQLCGQQCDNTTLEIPTIKAGTIVDNNWLTTQAKIQTELAKFCTSKNISFFDLTEKEKNGLEKVGRSVKTSFAKSNNPRLPIARSRPCSISWW